MQNLRRCHRAIVEALHFFALLTSESGSLAREGKARIRKAVGSNVGTFNRSS
jgi:hypothetical protein